MVGRKRMSALVALWAMACGGAASTEELPGTLAPLKLGSVVRLRAEAGRSVQGTVVAIDDQALTLGNSGSSSNVAIDSITGVEARVRRRRIYEGLAIGAGVGLVVSQLNRMDPVECERGSLFACSRGKAALAGLLGYGVIGAGAGTFVKKERWVPVDLRAGVELARAARGGPVPVSAGLPPPPVPGGPWPGCPNAPCSPIAASGRVRLAAPGVLHKQVIGQLIGSDAATLKVVSLGQTLRVRREFVTRLQRSARESRRPLGAMIGGGIGFIAGAGVGIALVIAEQRRSGSCDQCGMAVGMLGTAGAIPGALLGAAIAPGEKWVVEDPAKVSVEPRAAEHTNEPRRVRVGIAPMLGRGAGLRLSVAF